MANREENLKKINEELEKLSDEELENVAGGDFLPVPDKGRPIPDPGPLSFSPRPGAR